MAAAAASFASAAQMPAPAPGAQVRPLLLFLTKCLRRLLLECRRLPLLKPCNHAFLHQHQQVLSGAGSN